MATRGTCSSSSLRGQGQSQDTPFQPIIYGTYWFQTFGRHLPHYLLICAQTLLKGSKPRLDTVGRLKDHILHQSRSSPNISALNRSPVKVTNLSGKSKVSLPLHKQQPTSRVKRRLSASFLASAENNDLTAFEIDSAMFNTASAGATTTTSSNTRQKAEKRKQKQRMKRKNRSRRRPLWSRDNPVPKPLREQGFMRLSRSAGEDTVAHLPKPHQSSSPSGRQFEGLPKHQQTSEEESKSFKPHLGERLNPFKPHEISRRQTDLKVSSINFQQFHRWKHLYPHGDLTPAEKWSHRWKAFCEPAISPLTAQPFGDAAWERRAPPRWVRVLLECACFCATFAQ